jgi:hypothetical protein
LRAHVTLCMLALLLERTLEHPLARSSMPMSAPACLERLSGGHLALMRTAPEAPYQYRLTEPGAEQCELLRRLRLMRLVDEEALQTRLQPRDPA